MTNVPTTPEVAQQSPTGEQPRTWFFTFGAGQPYDGQYVTIAGTHADAREEMVRHFGIAWCDQYGSREAARIDECGLRPLAHRDWPSTAGLPCTPAEFVSAAAAGQPAQIRIARANMLREISRLCYAVGQPALPAPRSVRFGNGDAVTIELDTIVDAGEWAVEFGANDLARVEDSELDSGRWWIYTAHTAWRGFPVTLSAIIRRDPADDLSLDRPAQQREAVPA